MPHGSAVSSNFHLLAVLPDVKCWSHLVCLCMCFVYDVLLVFRLLIFFMDALVMCKAVFLCFS